MRDDLNIVFYGITLNEFPYQNCECGFNHACAFITRVSLRQGGNNYVEGKDQEIHEKAVFILATSQF